MDTRHYEVHYDGCEIKYLTATIIDENLLAQVDKEGHIKIILDKIIDHQRYDTDISKGQGTFTTDSGLLWKKGTTRVW